MAYKLANNQYLKFYFILLAFVMSLVGYGQNVIFPDSIRSCHVDSLLLNAGGGYDTYTWSTGATTPTAWINFSGDYSLTVTQGDTVTQTDNFYVVLISAGIGEEQLNIPCGDTIQLNGTDPQFSYTWTPGQLTTNSIVVYPRDTTMYYATIVDPVISYHYCIDSALVMVAPIIVVDSTIQSGTGCPGENKAKIKLEVSGGYGPLEYVWPAEAIPLFEDPSFAIGLTDGDKVVVISDTIGCFLNHEFTVKAHRIPSMDLYSDPSDTIFLQNPHVSFSFENPLYDSLNVDTFALAWFEWDFGDSTRSNLPNPSHVYQTDGSFTIELNFRTFYECAGTDTLSLIVRPVDLLIPAVITPNGDYLNDIFEIWEGTGGGGDEEEDEKSSYKSTQSLDPIDLNKYYLSNTLIIFNRWGEKVYEVDNYQNDWDGGGVSGGMYYYVLQCVGEHRTDEFKGSLLILDGGGLE